ncbi:MAG: response regulator, partial [Pseudomonadota bacterium]
MGDNPKVILLVDDEPDILNLLRTILMDEGHNVITATNGVEALNILSTESRVDLVITDIRMPQMNGIDLLLEIKKRDPFVPPVMFISGYSDISVEDAYALGVVGFIFKPFDIERMLKIISEVFTQFPKYAQRPTRADEILKIVLKYRSLQQSVEAKVI